MLAFVLAACGGRVARPAAPQPLVRDPEPQEIAPGSSPAPACGEEPGGPSQAQCMAIVEHLNQIMPGEMRPDRAADVCDCLQMPAGFIACLETVRSLAEANACVDPPMSGPTLAECKQTVAHLKVLDPRFAAESADEEVLTACMDEATRPELDCINSATTRTEIDRCDSPE